MTVEQVSTIVEAVVGLIILIVTTFNLIPWIKDKKVLEWVRIFVRAAEQIFEQISDDPAERQVVNSQRKEYVQTQLMNKGYTKNPEQINAMIESEVLKL